MPLPSSGALSLGDVNVELNNARATQIGLAQASVRTLYGIGSGPIRLAADGYGKSNIFSFTISTNQQEVNLRTLALAAGWNGVSSVQATVNSGVYIWSNNTGTAALTINGSWPNGVTLINNGFIIGRGGNGGDFNISGSGSNSTPGGPAISLGVNVAITNNSYIAGGGGGGANTNVSGGGGGAGGGSGGSGNSGAGGAGGSIGNSGANGGTPRGGGGGGRILPGVGGAGGTGFSDTNGKGGGAGGGGPTVAQQVGFCGPPGPTSPPLVAFGGSGGGGGWGASGGSSQVNRQCSDAGGFTAGSGGSAGNAGGNGTASGGSLWFSFAGSPGGNAVSLNGYSVTWNATGTRYGAIA